MTEKAHIPDGVGITPFAIADIVVLEDRQRTEFDKEKLLDLAYNIRDFQLMNPIVLSRRESDVVLIAGERRLRAITALHAKDYTVRFQNNLVPKGTVPALFIDDLSELQREEYELFENMYREDLTWQEEAKALVRLEALRNGQRESVVEEGEKVVAVTKTELAAETGRSIGTVSATMIVGKHLDDPDVAKAKSVKEARKIIEKKAKQTAYIAKGDSVDVSAIRHTFEKGDCRELIKKCIDGVFSTIVTDPPYGIDMHKDQSWDGTWHEYNDTEAYTLNLITDLLPEWDRVTKDEAHLYMFCDFAKFEVLKALMNCYRKGLDGVEFRPQCYQSALQDLKDCREDSARMDSWLEFCEGTEPVWDIMYFPMIWDKGNIASYPRPDHWPRKSYECILYAIKGDKKQQKLDLAVIDIPQVRDQEHPAGKPKELYKYLLARSVEPGDKVLDCFAGQGNVFVAAHELKCTATGFELNDHYYGIGVETLSTCTD